MSREKIAAGDAGNVTPLKRDLLVEVHHAFDRGDVARRLPQAGFEDVRFTTPFEIANGSPTRRYSVFLAAARRPR